MMRISGKGLQTLRWSFFILSLALVQQNHQAFAQDLDAVVAAAFQEAADGYSVDEVLIHDQRRRSFLADVFQRLPDTEEKEANLTLLRLRKTGKLQPTTFRRGTAADDDVRPAAEIAARMVSDQHGVTTDDMIADPLLREQLLLEAQNVFPDSESYDVLKHILGLRKARMLQPELVLRVADWKREIDVWSAEWLATNLESVPSLPGVYLFRNADGYLYIGEAVDLRRRLSQHLSTSDPGALASYLRQHGSGGMTIEVHSFSKESPAARLRMRRAYESELIRSRKPKLNVRP
jgi:predicted GIY-YIG superfamily endonuclease